MLLFHKLLPCFVILVTVIVLLVDTPSTLLLSDGDAESNPGPRPPKFPCGKSLHGLQKVQSILCESCDILHHAECVGISAPDLSLLGRSDLP